jgi:hypothetical protein
LQIKIAGKNRAGAENFPTTDKASHADLGVRLYSDPRARGPAQFKTLA